MTLFECPECKKTIERKTGKCEHCGLEITVCPKCDTVEVGKVAFCRSCGTDLGKYRSKQESRKNKKDKGQSISENSDLISCLNYVEQRNAFYKIIGIFKSVISAFFWTFFTFACVCVVAAAFVAMFILEGKIDGGMNLTLLFVNAVAVFSGLPVIMLLLYSLLINIPHSIISSLIVGVCSRKYSFDRRATLNIFKNPSLAYGMEEAFGRAYTIYPFRVSGSKGRVSGVIIGIFDLIFKILTPVMLTFTYIVYIASLLLSGYMSGDILSADSLSALSLPVVIGGVVLVFGIIAVCVLGAIFDIAVDATHEDLINRWSDDLQREESF